MKTKQVFSICLNVLCMSLPVSEADIIAQKPSVVGFLQTLDDTRTKSDEVSGQRPMQSSVFVNAQETLVGHTENGMVPVTLVQQAGAAFWVVQPQAQRSENGDFTTTVRFSGERRYEVSQFRIIVLAVPERHLLNSFMPGSRISKLPEDAVASPIYRVQRPASRINYSAVERQGTSIQ